MCIRDRQRAVEGGGVGGALDRHEGGLERVHRSVTCSASSSQWSTPPTARENGKMKAAAARPNFQPRSLTIMKKLAMQGMKSVITTTATRTWTGLRVPAWAMR